MPLLPPPPLPYPSRQVVVSPPGPDLSGAHWPQWPHYARGGAAVFWPAHTGPYHYYLYTPLGALPQGREVTHVLCDYILS